MKNVKQFFAVLIALVLLVGMLPMATVAATYADVAMEEGTHVLRANYLANADAVFQDPTLGLWPMYNRISSEETYVNLGGVWDRDYLYLAFENYGEDCYVTLKKKPMENVAEIKTTDTHTLVKVPLASAEVFMRDFGYSCELTVEVDELLFDGFVLFCEEDAKAGFAFQQVSGSGNNGAYGSIMNNGELHMWSNKGNAQFGSYAFRGLPDLASSKEATVLEFDFIPNKMPTFARLGTDNWQFCSGLIVNVTDEAAGPGKQAAFSFGIANWMDELCLIVGTSDTEAFFTGIPSDSKDPIHVRVEHFNENAYYNNPKDMNETTARFYVNGEFVGERVQAKTQGSSTSVAQALQFCAWPSVDGDLDFTLKNIKVGKMGTSAGQIGSLDDLDVESILGNNLSVNAINSDLTLPKYLPGGTFNGVVLEWSSNHAAIDNTGKVTMQAQDTEVELSVKIRDMETNRTFDLKVASAKATVPYSKAGVTLDGVVSDAGWALNQQLTGTGAPVALGMVRTDTDLFLSVEKTDVTGMTLIVNGKKVEAPAVKSGQTHTEIQIPLADVGLEIAADTVCPIAISLADVSWVGQVDFEVPKNAVGGEDGGFYWMIGAIAAAVVLLALLVLALIKKVLFKKVWYILLMAVALIACAACVVMMIL